MHRVLRVPGANNRVVTVALVLICLATAATAFGQGLPTGTLTGHVVSDNQALPGVTVTAKSPALQGSRTTVTSGTGDYAFVNVPPGDYTLAFAISGFQPLTLKKTVGASQTVVLNATMSLSGVAAQTVVEAHGEQISATAQAATTYNQTLLSTLPTARTIASAVNLTPGANTNGPGGAVTISGAQSFDNLFTVNGVQIQDNVRGTPFNLFIEDAIQEITTTTSTVSAEYGRFQGGVVNTITRSGGNVFSGSLRASLTNDAWSANTPRDPSTARQQELVPVYEATLGGPIWKDRIWFFGALRIPKTAQATSVTASVGSDYLGDSFPGTSYVSTNIEKRYEGKLTLSPFANHTLTGSYIRIDQTQGNHGFTGYPFLDLDSLSDRQLPQELFTGNYSGVLTSNLTAELQYSKRKFTFVNDGSQYTDLIKGTTIFDVARGASYNSPIFCATCPGAEEGRDNEDFLVKGTYFLSTPAIGSHTIVVGFDDFAGKRLSNNWQSGTSFAMNATDSIFKNGDIFPVLDSSSYLGFYPIPVQAKASDTRTYSAFVNDAWRLNNNLSFNVGVRWDANHAEDSRGAVTVKDNTYSPRLAVTYDPTGAGRIRFNASWARYVGALQDTQAGAASNAGNPAVYLYGYYGPEINTNVGPNGPFVTRAEALKMFFDYYGITHGNMFPTKNADTLFYTQLPGVNTQIRDGLTSPHTDEISFGFAGDISTKGTFRVDGVYRKAHDFYQTRTDRSTGQVLDAEGNAFDLGILESTDGPLKRLYYGVNVQVSYRPLSRLDVTAVYTWSHTYGNFIGETSGSGPVSSSVLQYPEFKQASWNYPTGDLAQDQRHRARLFATYELPTPKAFGAFTLSAIHSYDSGTPYGAVGTVRYCTTAGAACNWVTNPGYAQPPSGTGSPTYYYTARDAFHTDTINRTDVAINYSKSVGPIELFVRPDVLNLFNNQGVVAVNTSVLSRGNSSNFADFNPFTDTPKECPQGTATSACKAAGANWQKGGTFGQPTGPGSYQLARTFRVTMGVRF